MNIRRTILSLAIALAAAATASAAPRVFVSSTGLDSGSCAITTPCRTFAYALMQVSAGGEVIALDTAGYGPMTIAQSVSVIAAPGVTAFIAAPSSVNAVQVNAGVGSSVVLRGLSMNSVGSTYGIVSLNGANVNVENCIVAGFANGIVFNSPVTTKAHLAVFASTFRNNQDAVSVSGFGTGTPGGPLPPGAFATITGSTFITSFGYLISAGDNAHITVVDSTLTGGLYCVDAGAISDYAPAEVNLERCVLTGATGYAIKAGTSWQSQLLHGLVRIANCTITDNNTAFLAISDGQILSRTSNNVVTNSTEGNDSGSAPSGTFAAQ